MTAESGYILEHRETGRMYRPVGCLHVFDSVESAAFYRSVGFGGDGDKRWCVRPVTVGIGDEVSEIEMAEALRKVKKNGKAEVAEAGA